MPTTRRTRLALTGAALAAAGVALAAPSTAHAQAQSPAAYSGDTCRIKLTYGEAVASYSSQSSFFGTTTHVSLMTTGDAYRLVWNRVHVPGSHAERGITGIVVSPRGWTARSGYSPHVWLSVGVVDVNTGRYGTCRTR